MKKDKEIEEKKFSTSEDILSKEEFKLVVAIVNRGFASAAVDAARENGGDGAVIIEGRGVSRQARTFFGNIVEPENEVIMMVVREINVLPVIKAIYATVDYKSPGRGIVFALPVSCVTGLTHGSGERE